MQGHTFSCMRLKESVVSLSMICVRPTMSFVALAGLSFGMVWPLMVLITGEVFGNRHVGANYMWFDGMSRAPRPIGCAPRRPRRPRLFYLTSSPSNSGGTSSLMRTLTCKCNTDRFQLVYSCPCARCVTIFSVETSRWGVKIHS